MLRACFESDLQLALTACSVTQPATDPQSGVVDGGSAAHTGPTLTRGKERHTCAYIRASTAVQALAAADSTGPGGRRPRGRLQAGGAHAAALLPPQHR
jgi:hypothetical protein